MPNLVIPNTFSPNTTAQSAQVNANFSAVATLVNSTKLDSTNIQDGGIATNNLADGSVTQAKHANASVGTAQLIDANVTAAKLAADAIALVMPTGTILPYAGTSEPTGFLIADGRAVSRSTYANLFAVVSTHHGSGDGSTTFNLPDLRWKTIRGYAAIDDVAATGTVSSNNVTATAHPFTHSGIQVRVVGGSVSGLASGQTYYVIAVDANTIAFAASRDDSYAGTKIAISGTATGMTVSQVEDPDVNSRPAAAPGGQTGYRIGSIQDDAIASHTHGYTTPALTTVQAGGTASAAVVGTVVQTGGFGGLETRGKNIYFNHLIKT